ncbi:hypothetical protein ACS0TY_010557 [Phlomoides rotata]
MIARMKGFFISLLLLFLFLYAADNIDVNLVRPAYKGGNSRKLMGFNAVLDYDYAGPNPKHEQPRGKKGGGTKTP